MNKQTITLFQVSMILIGSIGIINHVIMIPMLLDTSGRDSWISIILVSILYLLWISIIFIIYKKIKNEHLFLWLKNNFGKFSVYPIIFI
ncbi:spore gernimation protein, partial [Bacillus tropicus]|nr:spore gernimation protein [Bacillus tropicus]